jgi:uncharacterized membrane protein AbrB (regulator of aidB expression)
MAKDSRGRKYPRSLLRLCRLHFWFFFLVFLRSALVNLSLDTWHAPLSYILGPVLLLRAFCCTGVKAFLTEVSAKMTVIFLFTFFLFLRTVKEGFERLLE